MQRVKEIFLANFRKSLCSWQLSVDFPSWFNLRVMEYVNITWASVHLTKWGIFVRIRAFIFVVSELGKQLTSYKFHVKFPELKLVRK
jgi:hypothetical protein